MTRPRPDYRNFPSLSLIVNSALLYKNAISHQVVVGLPPEVVGDDHDVNGAGVVGHGDEVAVAAAIGFRHADGRDHCVGKGGQSVSVKPAGL